MNLTDHGLICPEDGDYGALALLMQADAVAVEASLDGISDSLNSIYTEPYAMFVTTVGNGPLATGGEQEYNEGTWSLTNSQAFTVTIGGSLLGSVATLIVQKAGWYEYGNYVNLTLAGAATAFSRRSVFARAYSLATGVPVRLDEARWRTVENSQTGGEFLVASGGTFYSLAGASVLLTATWSHANAASSVSSAAGALTWVNYIGSGIEIGSA